VLIVEQLGMDPGEVEALDDDRFVEALSRARWLEERQVERVKDGLLRALAVAFRR
jgi:hypothetical protein